MNTATKRLLLRRELRWSGGGRGVSSFVKFNDYLLKRRDQAEKSILIQLPSFEVAKEVKSYLQSSFGPLDTLYHYSIPKKGSSKKYQGQGGGQTAEVHWLLAEFSDKESVNKCLKDYNHAEGTLPYNSAMCWYQSDCNNKAKCKSDDGGPEIKSESLETTNGQLPKFAKGSTLSQQLETLEGSTRLSELGERVRFFVASQLEKAFGNLFPHGCVLPFGSTVSGIGRQSGDLDLVLVPDNKEIFPSKRATTSGKLFAQSKLHNAVNSSNARFQSQRVMETMADVIQLFVPGCSHVQRILQARVPILRFSSDFTDLQCDLSMTNSSGVHMSELIYIMTQIEPRFPTLLFAIRAWASARKITNPVPGRQPTNFMFVLLLMYFLQKRQLLPTLDVLLNHSRTEDQRITADGIDCSFLRDTNLILKYFTPNTEDVTVAELLFDFYEFYSEFDFTSKGVSLVTGTSWGKPDAGPLYIQNPLERHLNVARNVSKEEVVRFKNECCSALWRMETSWHSLHQSGKPSGKRSKAAQEKDPVTVRELLLVPTLDTQVSSPQPEQRLQMKELFTK